MDMLKTHKYFESRYILLKISKSFFKKSNTHTHCPWKGEASYYTLNVNGETNQDAAWYYPTTSHAAKPIEGYIAFWKGVEITK